MPYDNQQFARRNDDYQQNSPNERKIPQNIEAEKSVLAALMLNAEAAEDILVKLKPSNFYRPAHRVIF